MGQTIGPKDLGDALLGLVLFQKEELEANCSSQLPSFGTETKRSIISVSSFEALNCPTMGCNEDEDSETEADDPCCQNADG